jgi:type VI secretion system secreted protein VgrG
MTSYRAEVHPKLWLLGKTRESRIFQKKKVPEIIKGIFSDHGVTPVEDKLKGTYAKREYCVQYQESDLDFVARLMEDEGIHYFFKHEDGKHTLVLADDSTAHPPCPNLAKAIYRGDVAASLADEDVVSSLEIEEQVITGSYAQGDYNFEMPSTSLLAKVDGKDASLKVFEYPGNHAAKGEGEDRAKLRLEAEEALAHRIVGTSYCRAMTAGHTFTLAEHERGDVNTDYIVAHVAHAATGQEYTNSFEAALKKTPLRPARVTARPIIHGAQTALVTGKSGEEIWTDKYGRIKVQFHWDRLGKKDEQSSCWVRVSQSWAGKGWGAFFLPRIGQEVIVSFLGGDPDRPLITGSVYNAEQTVPYGLPGAQTQSTIKTRSSKEGSAGNELRFEDKKDSEEVLLHAEKDQNFTVKNDFTTKVDHDVKVTVKHDHRGQREAHGDEGQPHRRGEEGRRDPHRQGQARGHRRRGPDAPDQGRRLAHRQEGLHAQDRRGSAHRRQGQDHDQERHGLLRQGRDRGEGGGGDRADEQGRDLAHQQSGGVAHQRCRGFAHQQGGRVANGGRRRDAHAQGRPGQDQLRWGRGDHRTSRQRQGAQPDHDGGWQAPRAGAVLR